MDVIELANDDLTVRLLRHGATLWQVIPAGDSVSLCTALDRPEDYLHNPKHIGVTAGVVANRIGGARFTLDGVEHVLEPNEGPNQLHGGPTAFGFRPWAAAASDDGLTVRFTLRRPDGEGGYPGNLQVEVTYQLDGPRLRYAWTASTDAPTPVSLANHAYWNLSGIPGPNAIADHELTVAAEARVEVDETLIPTGELARTASTRFDLQQPTALGTVGDLGIDHCYVLTEPESMAARLAHPKTNRSLTVATSLPGMQVYLLGQRSVCLETQHFPDAVNQPAFPTCIVRPGSPIAHWTDYVFGSL